MDRQKFEALMLIEKAEFYGNSVVSYFRNLETKEDILDVINEYKHHKEIEILVHVAVLSQRFNFNECVLLLEQVKFYEIACRNLIELKSTTGEEILELLEKRYQALAKKDHGYLFGAALATEKLSGVQIMYLLKTEQFAHNAEFIKMAEPYLVKYIRG